MSQLLAHSDALRQRSTSVAFGAKRTLTKPRCRPGQAGHLLRKGLRERTAAPPPEQQSDGWKVGVDGSVAIIAIGAGGAIDTNTVRSPIVGFIFDQKGLMYNLTLEGSKITRIFR
jgi:hypothetical protein